MSNSTNNNSKFIIFLFSSIIALVSAYALEYFFNILPCKLCIYERIIYYITGLSAIIYMIKNSKILIYTMFCSYFIGIIISFYHVGLEFNLFNDILGCTEQINNNASIEKLKNDLLNPNNYPPSCNRPYYILGISLAMWNLIYLTIALFIASYKMYYEKEKKF
ncbi:MAG: disulfide bond formation protein B [Wolbachia endosymbiont of Menacanthus eurysternus]|nr:MAG: disulfide bond formation protein B [Wolbachia endosymbiont of Menacanthus eurysternus]